MSMRWQTAGVCALAACAAFCGRANPVKPYAEALKDGKDMMILCVGSDWMPDADRYIAAFRTAAQGFSGEVTWALYDRRAGLGDEQAKARLSASCRARSTAIRASSIVTARGVRSFSRRPFGSRRCRSWRRSRRGR